MSLVDPPVPSLPVPVAVGEHCTRSLRLSREQIAQFADLTGDTNALHHDAEAARRARHGEIIAAGQHTTSMMIGLASTHFSRPGEGFARELLCLNFNFAFKQPVFAEQELRLHWQVATVEWHPRLEGWLLHVDGHAVVADADARPSVVGRGMLLVKAVPVA
ncbi:MAG: hypothetical protein RLY78_3237 [Pseudomonadota bacterium]|jgi:acyl dehydratase|uniref:MaoC family dehydratase n=1 Tax=Pseudaquabacterium rugosum TaxID=2984194 RepID=A0ABU9B4J1_9BURK